MATGAQQSRLRQEWRPARGEAPADLGSRLLACARGSPTLRRAVARVAGRLVATKGWERLGFARLGDHAAERAGVSGRELRDLAAVDRALAELRGLERAFLDGRIGWTSLRLLCRVARPEDQGRWLALADALSARELAREVRAVDRQAQQPLPAGPDERRAGVVLRIPPARAGALVAHARSGFAGRGPAALPRGLRRGAGGRGAVRRIARGGRRTGARDSTARRDGST